MGRRESNQTKQTKHNLLFSLVGIKITDVFGLQSAVLTKASSSWQLVKAGVNVCQFCVSLINYLHLLIYILQGSIFCFPIYNNVLWSDKH